MNFKTFFHYISYLQYPLMVIVLYFTMNLVFLETKEIEQNPNLVFEQINSLLIFLGLMFSFSSLQNTSKKQNKFLEKIWKSPIKGKIALILISILTLLYILLGLFGYYLAKDGILKEISIGSFILGLGIIGYLKTEIEIFENNRIDKVNTTEKK